MNKRRKSHPLTPQPESSFRVTILSEKGLAKKPSYAMLRRAVRQTLRHQAFHEECSVSLLLAQDGTLAHLNGAYRGIPHSTDVLSFSSGWKDPETGAVHLGDVILSVPRALEQARARGRLPEEEFSLLVVHGILHLLGYDHDTPTRKAKMWRLQREILAEQKTTR